MSRDVIEGARNAKFEGLNRSKTLLRVLAAIRGISYGKLSAI
ncbi:MAG: hypothetical protein QXX84_05065 [Sulfolobales archaeon]